MKCPKCGMDNSKIIDSRISSDGGSRRRRRHECLTCTHRFTTVEIIILENHINLNDDSIILLEEMMQDDETIKLFEDFRKLINNIKVKYIKNGDVNGR